MNQAISVSSKLVTLKACDLLPHVALLVGYSAANPPPSRSGLGRDVEVTASKTCREAALGGLAAVGAHRLLEVLAISGRSIAANPLPATTGFKVQPSDNSAPP